MKAVTIKSMTLELNRLENQANKFPANKEMQRAFVTLQLQYATTLLGVLNVRFEMLSEERLTEAMKNELNRGRDGFVPLIRLLRERHGWGLGEAKKYAEDIYIEYGYGTRSESGYVNWK